MSSADKLRKILKDNGFSITEQRLNIFEALNKLNQPISVVNLANNLKNVDKVSVYRTIDLFEKADIVHRVWTGFKSKVELSEDFSAHHHHFTCKKCGKTVNLKSDKLEKDLHIFEQEHGFKLVHHSVELSGYCRNCK